MEGVLHWIDGVNYVGTIPLGWGMAYFILHIEFKRFTEV